MSTLALVLLATFGQVSAAAPPNNSPGAAPPAGSDPTFSASVRAEHDIRVFAEVEGLLTTLTVREGSQVKEGQVIATIDDRNAQAAVDVAEIAFHAADETAKDTVEERYAAAAAAVAKADYEMGLQANSSRSGQKVISEIDMQKKKLDWKRAVLQIEKAQKDRRLARLEADTKQAELRAAKIALERRTIVAPFDGEVQLMLLHDSEWVNPGDPILRLVQFNVMWVECYVSAEDYDPADLQGRPVTVRLNLARGRQVAVEGRVVYVNQSVVDTTAGFGEYLVRAEVQNQRTGDFWLVRPGLPATMTIHVNQPAAEAAAAAGPASSLEQR